LQIELSWYSLGQSTSAEFLEFIDFSGICDCIFAVLVPSALVIMTLKLAKPTSAAVAGRARLDTRLHQHRNSRRAITSGWREAAPMFHPSAGNRHSPPQNRTAVRHFSMVPGPDSDLHHILQTT